jgi:release factor glutamine methyltransferase
VVAAGSGPSGDVWTVGAALAWTVEYFEGKSVEAPRRSAEWLLSEATGLTRVELYAHHDRPLSPEERERLRELVKARASGTPLQYVTGEVCFRHLVLKVRPGVFIPRPETEVLVDVVLEELADRVTADAADPGPPVVADICTGSGAVALSVAHEHPSACVWATELVEDTAQAARENAARCGLDERVTVLTGDLLAPLPADVRGSVDVVVSNPPYIPTADVAALPPEVADFEPPIALDGGDDGLTFARRIMVDAREWLAPGGLLLMELDTGRCAEAAREATALGYEEVNVRPDLTGRDRIIIARRSKGGGGP